MEIEVVIFVWVVGVDASRTIPEMHLIYIALVERVSCGISERSGSSRSKIVQPHIADNGCFVVGVIVA